MKDVRDQTVGELYDTIVGKPAVVVKGDVLKTAVDAMIANPISQKVYIVDKKGKLLGMISMNGLLEQVGYRVGTRKIGIVSWMKFLHDLLEENVELFMKKPISIQKNDMITQALKKMLDENLNDLPVIDENGLLLGELNGLEILTAARGLFQEKLKEP